MGIAYKINRVVFSQNNYGKVTPAERVGVIDFTSDTTNIEETGYMNVTFIPEFADYYKFRFESSDTDIAIIDPSTGLILGQSTGDVIITITEIYSGISKNFPVHISIAYKVNFTQYLVDGKRPRADGNPNGGAYNPINDNGQSYTPANAYEIPSGYSRVKILPFSWWVSTSAARDTKAVIFLDENGIILAGYTYREVWATFVSSEWNVPTENFEPAIPAGAKYLCISTELLQSNPNPVVWWYE